MTFQVVRQPEKTSESDNKTSKSSSSKEEIKTVSESSGNKPERKYSDFRTRLAEEKMRKTFYKRNSEPVKASRKGMPDEKGDKANVGNSSETAKKTEPDPEVSKKITEPKSKFRYSEQRNRDRECRSQKSSDAKKVEESSKVVKEEPKEKTENLKSPKKSSNSTNRSSVEQKSHSSRRKSLELEREVVDEERKRSKSLHDSSDNDGDIITVKSNKNSDENGQTDGSKESNGSDKKDPRVERRIRNKDRPSIEIYRPGMGKFSKQRLEQKKDDTNCVSPTGTLNKTKNSNKPANKPPTITSSKIDEALNKNNVAKTASEVRTMTFTRSSSKEN